MINFLSLSLLVLVQAKTPPPPVPKMGPSPPVGDVPIDGNLWILVVVALFMGVLVLYRNRKRAL